MKLDIQRTLRVITFEDAEIEISLDIGEVRTESATQEIHEVEFELKSGSIQSFYWLLVLNGLKNINCGLMFVVKLSLVLYLWLKKHVSPATGAKKLFLIKKIPPIKIYDY